MSSNLHEPKAPEMDRHDGDADGLSSDELRAEQAGNLPEREAMSILDVGAIGGGLPTPEMIHDIVDSQLPDLPPGIGPVDTVPSQPLPPDQIPIDWPVQTLPVQPIDTLPEQPIGIPELPDVTAEADINV